MTIEEQARQAFHTIYDKEYQCALAESQCSGELFCRVKKEYDMAEKAFILGAGWLANALIELTDEHQNSKKDDTTPSKV